MYLTRFRDLIKRQRNSLIEDHFPKLQIQIGIIIIRKKYRRDSIKRKTHKVATTKPDKKKISQYPLM